MNNTTYQYLELDNNYPLLPRKITFVQVHELILLRLNRYMNNTIRCRVIDHTVLSHTR